MTNTEFSDEMDVIYENINKGGAVGLDPYEKSVILTMAQEKLAIELLKVDTASVPQLVDTVEVTAETTDPTGYKKIDQRSKLFKLPSNYISILTETVKDNNTAAADRIQFILIPLSPVEYQSLMYKPYNYPSRRTAWRMVGSSKDISDGGDPEIVTDTTYVEVVGPNNVTLQYYTATITVLPNPIVLEDLPNGLAVRGISTEAITNLSDAYHPTILEYATTLAERYYFDKYGAPQQGQAN